MPSEPSEMAFCHSCGNLKTGVLSSSIHRTSFAKSVATYCGHTSLVEVSQSLYDVHSNYGRNLSGKMSALSLVGE